MAVDELDFGNFVSVLKRAEIIDATYPVKGCCVWLPRGVSLKERVFDTIEDRLRDTGYEKYQFPRLIPGEAIREVTAGIANFENGVFWLRKKDGSPLDLFLNPTGECGVYTMLKKWIRTESDLPLRMYQVGNTFRPHKKADVMLNGDEFAILLEAHSAFSTKEDANEEFYRMVSVFEEIHRKIGIPSLVLRRPIVGNKPVCVEMVSFETYLPSKRTSFNVGVLYNQDTVYSQVFGITFSSQDGKKDYTHQVTFGISERSLAAMLDLHRDNFGLRLLPEFSPTQVVIIPVYGGCEDRVIDEYATEIEERLRETYSTIIDHSNKNAGKKLAKARQEGIPIRIGISVNDVSNRTMRVFIRTDEEPLNDVPLEGICSNTEQYMIKVRQKIIEESEEYVQSKIHPAKDFRTAKNIINEKQIARIHWCGSATCLTELGRKLPGEMLGTQFKINESDTCLVCGKNTPNPAYYATRGASP